MTKDTMLTRVAEALARSRGVKIVDEVDYRLFEADARAAIEAMREPTTAMLRKADDTTLTDEELQAGPYELIKAEWQAMIDEALR